MSQTTKETKKELQARLKRKQKQLKEKAQPGLSLSIVEPNQFSDSKIYGNIKDGHFDTIISEAIKEGNIDVIKQLFRTKAHVHAQEAYKDFKPTLSFFVKAAFNGKLDILQYLITLGGGLNAFPKDVLGYALYLASYFGQKYIVRYLLDEKIDARWKTFDEHTALISAAIAGYSEIVEMLIPHSDINVKAKGFTALSLATFHSSSKTQLLGLMYPKIFEGSSTEILQARDRAITEKKLEALKDGSRPIASESEKIKKDNPKPTTEKNYFKTVELLLQQGADQTIQDTHNRVPLFYAAAIDSALLIKFLARVKPEEATRLIHLSGKDGLNAFHFAVHHQREDCVELLLDPKYSVDINASTVGLSLTPLHLACSVLNLRLIQILLDHNANVNTKSYGECTLLQLALGLNFTEASLAFIKHGACVKDYFTDIKNIKYLPLHLAANSAEEVVVKAILSRLDKTDITAKDTRQRTAFYYAFLNENPEAIVKVLVEAGIEVNATGSEDSHSPLLLAAQHGNLALVQYLLDKGAIPYFISTTSITALGMASIWGHTEIVDLLLDKLEQAFADHNINEEQLHETLYNAIHAAIFSNKTDSIKVLFEKILKHKFYNNIEDLVRDLLYWLVKFSAKPILDILFSNEIFAQTLNEIKYDLFSDSDVNWDDEQSLWVINFLIKKCGLEVNYRDPVSGFTVLATVTALGKFCIAATLVDLGADINSVSQHKTPMMIAQENNQDTLSFFFLEKKLWSSLSPFVKDLIIKVKHSPTKEELKQLVEISARFKQFLKSFIEALLDLDPKFTVEWDLVLTNTSKEDTEFVIPYPQLLELVRDCYFREKEKSNFDFKRLERDLKTKAKKVIHKQKAERKTEAEATQKRKAAHYARLRDLEARIPFRTTIIADQSVEELLKQTVDLSSNSTSSYDENSNFLSNQIYGGINNSELFLISSAAKQKLHDRITEKHESNTRLRNTVTDLCKSMVALKDEFDALEIEFSDYCEELTIPIRQAIEEEQFERVESLFKTLLPDSNEKLRYLIEKRNQQIDKISDISLSLTALHGKIKEQRLKEKAIEASALKNEIKSTQAIIEAERIKKEEIEFSKKLAQIEEERKADNEKQQKFREDRLNAYQKRKELQQAHWQAKLAAAKVEKTHKDEKRKQAKLFINEFLVELSGEMEILKKLNQEFDSVLSGKNVDKPSITTEIKENSEPSIGRQLCLQKASLGIFARIMERIFQQGGFGPLSQNEARIIRNILYHAKRESIIDKFSAKQVLVLNQHLLSFLELQSQGRNGRTFAKKQYENLRVTIFGELLNLQLDEPYSIEIYQFEWQTERTELIQYKDCQVTELAREYAYQFSIGRAGGFVRQMQRYYSNHLQNKKYRNSFAADIAEAQNILIIDEREVTILGRQSRHADANPYDLFITEWMKEKEMNALSRRMLPNIPNISAKASPDPEKEKDGKEKETKMDTKQSNDARDVPAPTFPQFDLQRQSQSGSLQAVVTSPAAVLETTALVKAKDKSNRSSARIRKI